MIKMITEASFAEYLFLMIIIPMTQVNTVKCKVVKTIKSNYSKQLGRVYLHYLE